MTDTSWATRCFALCLVGTVLTPGSENDNVRPFVIRDLRDSSPLVLWMENRYYRHYLDFDSAIRINRVRR